MHMNSVDLPGLPAATPRAALAEWLEKKGKNVTSEAKLEAMLVERCGWLEEVGAETGVDARAGAKSLGWSGGLSEKLGPLGLLLALRCATGRCGKRLVCSAPTESTPTLPTSLLPSSHRYHLVESGRVGSGLGAVKVTP